MSRPASGDAKVLQDAREAIACAKTVEQLRQAQVVVFPLDYSMSLADTAQAIGVLKGWDCQLRTSGLPNTALTPANPAQIAIGLIAFQHPNTARATKTSPNPRPIPRRIWATAFVGAGLARADFWSAKYRAGKPAPTKTSQNPPPTPRRIWATANFTNELEMD